MSHRSLWNIPAIFVLTVGMIVSLGLLGSTSYAEHPTQTATITSVESLQDGDLIKLADHHDVYIYKIAQDGSTHKRLILNPTIFESYGHLRWDNIKTVSLTVLNAISTSTLVREVDEKGVIVGEGKVYHLIPDGDVGMKRHIQLTADQFLEAGGNPMAIYNINSTEASDTFYRTGAPITTVSEFVQLVINANDTIVAPTPSNDGSSGRQPPSITGSGQQGDGSPSDGGVTRPPTPPEPSAGAFDDPPTQGNDDQTTPPTQGDDNNNNQDDQDDQTTQPPADTGVSAPTYLVVNDKANATVGTAVVWATVTGATSYELQYSTNTSLGCQTILGAWKSIEGTAGSVTSRTGIHLVAKGLTKGTYQFRVRAVKGTERSSWYCTTKAITVAPATQSPGDNNDDQDDQDDQTTQPPTNTPTSLTPPTNFAVSQVATGIRVTWTPVEGATSYRIAYCGGSVPCTNVPIVTASSNSSHTIAITLEPGKAYYIGILARAGSVSSPWSSPFKTLRIPATQKPPTQDPPTQDPPTKTPTSLESPTNVAVAQTSTGLRVTWTPVTGATVYRVAYCGGSVSCTAGNIPVVTASSSNSHDITLTLEPGKYYRAAVLAKAGSVYSKWSKFKSIKTPSDSTPPQNPPATPTGLTATGSGTGSNKTLRLAWTDVTGVSYEVQYRVGSSSSTVCQSGIGANDWIGNGAYGTVYTVAASGENRIKVEQLSGTTYTGRVRSVKNNLRSAWVCAEKTFSSTTPTKLAAPTGVTATLVSNGIRVSWNAVAGATGYKIGYCGGSASCATTPFPTATSSTTSKTIVLTVGSNTIYRFKVRALAADSTYNSKWSNQYSLRID